MCLCMFVCRSESKRWCTQTWWVCAVGFCAFAFFGTVRPCLNIGVQACVCFIQRERENERGRMCLLVHSPTARVCELQRCPRWTAGAA